MKKHQNSKPTHPECWDDGTYRTGSTRPPKASSPLVAFLLCAVIFLGGIASALGLVNIRLLQQLRQNMEPTLPIAMQTGPAADGQTAFIGSETEPSIPDDVMRELTLQDQNTDEDPAPDVYTLGSRSMVTVTAYDSAQVGIDCAGVVLSEDGLILTNASCLETAQQVYVTLPEGDSHRAALVGSDPLTDLAVLYISASGLQAAEFADSACLSEGAAVVFLGTERRGEGVISGRRENVSSGGRRLTLLQVTASDNTAGGAVFAASGQVVGILCPKFADFLDAGSDCAGFMLPSSTVKAIVDRLLQFGYVSGRPGLGAQAEEVTDLYQDYWKIPRGLLITESDEESGLRKGDILLSINGEAIHSGADLNRVLFRQSVGRKVTAVVYRDGKRICLELTLQEHIPNLSRR